MDAMIERGAAAMAARRRKLIARPLQEIWPDLMRAALEAMREPTPEMERAYYGSCDEAGMVLWKHGYRTMIDAALAEPSHD